MARPLRLEYEGAIYHITARGNERKKIFFSRRDYDKFKAYLVLAKERFGCIVHAYVLMGNHYHLILETPDKNFSRIMHYLNSSYTTYINTKRKRSRHLLQGRFKSIIVDEENYLLELSRYVHLNPLRAGMVEHPEEYRDSSYKHYVAGAADDVVTSRMILEMVSAKVSGAREKYRKFVESAIGADLENPLKKVYGGLILGSERFVRVTLDRLQDEQLADEEISCRRALQAGLSKQQLMRAVMRHFQLSPEELATHARGRERKFAIYLLKHYAGATSREVGELIKGMSGSAVAKTYQRFAKQVETDRTLQQEVEGNV